VNLKRLIPDIPELNDKLIFLTAKYLNLELNKFSAQQADAVLKEPGLNVFT
jgi:hypothetical protein